MKKRILAVLLATALAVPFLVGCGNDAPAEVVDDVVEEVEDVVDDAVEEVDEVEDAVEVATGGGDHYYDFPVLAREDIVIGFNQGSSTVDFLRIVGESLEIAAAEAGVGFVFAESNFDVERIMPNVDSLLLQGANIIVCFNVNEEVGGSLVDYLGEQGVPIIGIDVLFTGATGAEGWFVGADNQAAGEAAGYGLARAVQEQWDGEIEHLVLFWNSENGDLVRKRLSGVYDGLINNGIDLAPENVTYIDLGGGGSDTTLVGNEKFTDWLTAHPDLTRIGVATVNPETGQGVFSATQTANRDDHVLLVTNNNGNQTLAAFELGDNSWVGGSAFFPNRYGEMIVDLAIEILTGQNPPRLSTVNHMFLGRGDENDILGELGL